METSSFVFNIILVFSAHCPHPYMNVEVCMNQCRSSALIQTPEPVSDVNKNLLELLILNRMFLCEAELWVQVLC